MNDRKRSILIAEDEDNDFWFFEWAFNKEAKGVSLMRAKDGLEAIQYLAGEGQYADRLAYPLPLLLILDLRMPRKDGFALLEWTQEHMQSSWLPKIVLSSSESASDMERAFRLGANSYLIKPRQYDRYMTLVHLIKEYWLEWNQNPTSGQKTLPMTLAATVEQYMAANSSE